MEWHGDQLIAGQPQHLEGELVLSPVPQAARGVLHCLLPRSLEEMDEGNSTEGASLTGTQCQGLFMHLQCKRELSLAPVDMSEVVVHRFPVLEGGVWVGCLDLGQSLDEVLGCLCQVACVGQHHSNLLAEDRVIWGHGQSTLHEADGSGGGASDVVLTAQLNEGKLRASHDPRCLGEG